MPTWLKIIGFIIGFIIVFIIVIAIISGGKEQNNIPSTQNEPSKEEATIIKISAVKLSEEYDANKVAADMEYKGKTAEISGIIDSIGKDILDTPYITLKGKEAGLFGVQCMFDKDKESELAKLSKGQNIILQGKISSELIGNIVVSDCSIVE